MEDLNSTERTIYQFCANCGKKLNTDINFCPNCGVPIRNNINAPYNQKTISAEQDNCHRIQYESKNIGNGSLQKFLKELMMVENSRRHEGVIESFVHYFLWGETQDEILNKKKVTLIKNFPIPNNIKEINDFMILAAGNINVNLSKKSLGNKFWNDSDTSERGVSDAWVEKLQQAYNKAYLNFSQDSSFAKITEIYTNKMKQLNMLSKKRIRKL